MNKEYVVHRALSCKVPGRSQLTVGETERMQPLDRAGRKGTPEYRLHGPWQEEREEGAGSPGLGAGEGRKCRSWREHQDIGLGRTDGWEEGVLCLRGCEIRDMNRHCKPRV